MRRRLYTANIKPFRRAVDLEHCGLYWLPVGSFPVPAAERTWLMEFLDRWGEAMRRQCELRIEQFLSLRAISPLLTTAFTRSSQEFKPIPGMGWRAVARPAKQLTAEEVEALQQGTKKFKFSEYVDDQCYWFLNKAERKQREQFFGHGGMTTLYMKPDSKTQAPPLPISTSKLRASPVYGAVFAKLDLDGMLGGAWALQDSFLPKSRKLFAEINPADEQLQKARFVVPLLKTRDFFERPAEDCERWFELFDAYLTESPEDQGILLASKNDIDEILVSVVERMTSDGLNYPER